MAITIDATVVAAPNQVSCSVAGESAILDTRDGVHYGLTPVGAFVWNLLARPIQVRELRDALLDEFDVEAERCEGDLLALLNELVQHGLIVVHATT